MFVQLCLPFFEVDVVVEDNLLPPYAEDVLLPELEKWNRVRGGALAAPVLADLLGISERTTRHYLRLLEQAGIVERPFGVRSGWRVVRADNSQWN